jgi:hypothetical protein
VLHVCVRVCRSSHGSLTCTAPAGCGSGTLFVTVMGVMDGVNRSVSVPFEYDGPAVLSVANLTTDASLPSVINVTGVNFGSSGHAVPSVLVGRCTACGV